MIKWCPHAGCGLAVKLPEVSEEHKQKTDKTPLSYFASIIVSRTKSDFSRSVDCGNGHMFCWFV